MSFGDSLTDDDVRGLVAKHGAAKVGQLLDLPDDASDDQIKSLLQASQITPPPQAAAAPQGVGAAPASDEKKYGVLRPQGKVERFTEMLKSNFAPAPEGEEPQNATQFPAQLASGISAGADKVGGALASTLAEHAHGIPAGIPAALGTVTSLAVDPLNYAAGPAKGGAEALSLAGAAGRAAPELMHNIFTPTGVKQGAEAVKAVGTAALKAPGQIVEGAKDLWGQILNRPATPYVPAAGARIIEEAPAVAKPAWKAPEASPQGLADLAEASKAAESLPGTETAIGGPTSAQQAGLNTMGVAFEKPSLPVPRQTAEMAGGWEKPDDLNDLLDKAALDEPSHLQAPGVGPLLNPPAGSASQNANPTLINSVPRGTTPASSGVSVAAPSILNDENVLLHGTSKVFGDFEDRSGGMWGNGTYFTKDPEVASMHATRSGFQNNHIRLSKVDFGNTFDLTKPADLDFWMKNSPENIQRLITGMAHKKTNAKIFSEIHAFEGPNGGAEGIDRIMNKAGIETIFAPRGEIVVRKAVKIKPYFNNPEPWLKGGESHDVTLPGGSPAQVSVAPDGHVRGVDLATGENFQIPPDKTTPEPYAPPAENLRIFPEDTGAEAMVDGAAVRQIDPRTIGVDPERFQFKATVDAERGIQKALQGKFDPLKAGNVLLWEDRAGKLWAVNGHHRLQLALGDNAPWMNAQIVREADGITDAQAMRLGAELNIAEGRGTVYDAAKFFRGAPIGEAGYTPKELAAKGLANSPGLRIGTRASDDFYAAFQAEKLDSDQADAIVKITSDPGEQALGLSEAIRNPRVSPSELGNFIAAARASAADLGVQQVDLFGANNDAALNHARDMARAASALQRDIKAEINASKGAVKRPELAAKAGVKVENQKAAETRLAELKALSEKLDSSRWFNDPEAVDMVSRRAFGVPSGEEEPVALAADPDQIDLLADPEAGGTVLVGQLLGAAEDALEAGKNMLYKVEPGKMDDPYNVIPDAMRQVFAKLGLTGLVNAGSPILRFIARPEDIAPALQRIAARTQDNAYASMQKYSAVIDKVSKNISRRAMKAGTYNPAWLEMKREHQGLTAGEKLILTKGDLVAFALDGQIPVEQLPQDVREAVGAVRKVYDAVAALEGFKNTPLYRPDYYPRIWDDPATIRQLQDASQLDNTPFGPLVSDPFLKARKGKGGYSLDWDKASRARIWQAHKKVYMEPLALKIDDYVMALPNTPTGNAAKSYLTMWRDDLLGRPGAAEKNSDDVLKWATTWVDKATRGNYIGALEKLDRSAVIRGLRDRGIINKPPSFWLAPGRGWTREMSNQVADSIFYHLMAYSMSTATKNLFQGINTVASEGVVPAMVGYAKTFPQMFTAAGREFLKNDVMRDMEGIWDGYHNTRGLFLFDAIKRLGRKPMELAEMVNRGAAYHAGMYEGAALAKKGLLPNTKAAIHEYALGVVDKTQFRYGVTNTNPYFQNPYGKVLRILTSFPQAQTMFTFRLAQNNKGEKIAGMPAGFIRLLALQGLVAAGALKLGYDLSDTVGAKNVKKPGDKGKGEIPVPIVGAPAQFAAHLSDQSPPGVKLAQGLGDLVSGDFKGAGKKLAEVGSQAVLGKMGVPKEAFKVADLLKERQTGFAEKGRKPFITNGFGQARDRAYRINPDEAVQKYFGLRPKVQRAYQAAMQEKYDKGGR